METREKKIAAFFKLLDEWSRARDADLFLWRLRARLFNSRGGQPSLLGALGGLWGGGRLSGCVPLHLIYYKNNCNKMPGCGPVFRLTKDRREE